MDKDTRTVMRMISFVVVIVSVTLFGQLYQSTHNKVFLIIDFGIVIVNAIYVLLDYRRDSIQLEEDVDSDKFFSIFKEIYQQNKEKEFEQVLHSNALDTMHKVAEWQFLGTVNICQLQLDKAKTLFYFDKFMHSLKEYLKENPEVTEEDLRQKGE